MINRKQLIVIAVMSVILGLPLLLILLRAVFQPTLITLDGPDSIPILLSSYERIPQDYVHAYLLLVFATVPISLLLLRLARPGANMNDTSNSSQEIEMNSKIIVFERDTHEIMLFSSIGDAQSYLEPPDIDLYEVFDIDAHVFELSIERPAFSYGWVVVNPAGRSEQNRLIELLRAQILTLGLPEPDASSTVPDLIKILEQSGYKNPG